MLVFGGFYKLSHLLLLVQVEVELVINDKNKLMLCKISSVLLVAKMLCCHAGLYYGIHCNNISKAYNDM